jgi:phage terminase small subunit
MAIKRYKQPTIRQKKLLKTLTEENTATEALKKAGYSKSVSEHMQKIVTKRAIKAHMDIQESLPDKERMELNTKVKIISQLFGEDWESKVSSRISEIAFNSPQHAVSVNVLSPVLEHMGYHMKGETQAPAMINVVMTQAPAPHVYEIDSPTA